MTEGIRKIARTPSAHSYPLLLKQLLHTPVLHNSEQKIMYRDKKSMTYRDLARRIARLGSGLLALGAKAGDTIAVLDWDSPRYLETYFGVPGIGAVLHCVNVRLPTEQILFTMNHSEDSVVILHEDFLSLAENIKDRLPNVKKWVLIKEFGRDIPSSLTIDCDYEQLLSMGREDYVFPDFDEDAMATLFYTTGTTGDPKGVYFSHRQLVLHTLGLMAVTGSISPQRLVEPADVYMPITPMFHVHAWGMPYLATAMGIKQVYPGRYDPEMLVKLFLKEKVTFSHCVPTLLQMLLASPATKKVDFTGWKVIIGGSTLPRGLAQAALDRGIDIYGGYGMSETCPVLTIATLKPDMDYTDLASQLDYRTSTGRAIPLVELKIMDPLMNELPFDGQTTGEIVVRAPWLTQGYFKNPERSEELWRGGYLHTGDVANVDPEGYVRITDRIKDIIKSGGEWVSSVQLEDLISQHPAVAEVAVIGVPDERWGERPMAFIVPAGAPDDFPYDDLKRFLTKFVDDGIISRYYVPEKFSMVSEIPKTSVGKLDKKVIRRNLRNY